MSLLVSSTVSPSASICVNLKFKILIKIGIGFISLGKLYFFLTFIFSSLLGLSTNAADYARGMNAALNGDYLTAYKEWKPLAEKNEATPQFQLGWLYEKGLGVNLNYDMAAHWYLRAAEQGYAYAQTALGRMYTDGRGINRDVIRAYMWFSIAAGLWDPDAKHIQETIAKTMSPQDIRSAQRLAQHCVQKYFKDC